MQRIVDWLDRSVEELTKWLNNNISGRHPLAFAGSAISGVDQAPLLPRDRRIGSNMMLMADKTHKVKKGETVKEIAKKYGIKDWKKGLWEQQSKKFLKENPNPDLIAVGLEIMIPMQAVGDYADKGNKECGFWALCGMAGYPCTRCGGSNGFDGAKTKCPSGLKQGAGWAGYCKDPGGTMRYLTWQDCCADVSSPCGSGSGCKNASVADWCEVPKIGKYVCTVILHSPDQDKTS